MSQPQPVKSQKIQPDKVKAGDILAFVNYVVVADVIRNPDEKQKVVLTDLDNDTKLEIDNIELIENALSADQFTTTVIINKSEIAQTFSSAYGKPFTVNFLKQDNAPRTLRGRLIVPESLMGRSYVEDLDVVNGQNRVRLVDHRTIQYLIVGGTKYEIK